MLFKNTIVHFLILWISSSYGFPMAKDENDLMNAPLGKGLSKGSPDAEPGIFGDLFRGGADMAAHATETAAGIGSGFAQIGLNTFSRMFTKRDVADDDRSFVRSKRSPEAKPGFFGDLFRGGADIVAGTIESGARFGAGLAQGGLNMVKAFWGK